MKPPYVSVQIAQALYYLLIAIQARRALTADPESRGWAYDSYMAAAGKTHPCLPDPKSEYATITLPDTNGALNLLQRTLAQSILMSNRKALVSIYRHVYQEALSAYSEGDVLLQYIMGHYSYELRRFTTVARNLEASKH